MLNQAGKEKKRYPGRGSMIFLWLGIEQEVFGSENALPKAYSDSCRDALIIVVKIYIHHSRFVKLFQP
jgi:hypothetical protein